MQSSIKKYFSSSAPARPVEFVDLFCGFGGASVGAVAAGLKVVLAVDSSDSALEIHRQNHPQTKQLCANLPHHKALPLPPAGTPWHLHGSPPCTSISPGNQDRIPEHRRSAVSMIEWFVQFAVDSSAVSWSMEEVPSPIVMQCMQKLRGKLNKTRFDYDVFNFSNLGIPQNRRRLIAGTPDVVARLRRAPLVRVSVSSVIKRTRGTHIRNKSTRGKLGRPTIVDGKNRYKYYPYTKDDCCVPVTGPSHCVIAGGPLFWASPHAKEDTKLLLFSVDETLKLQCFPPNYLLPRRKADCIRGIGNALPPPIMKQMLTDA